LLLNLSARVSSYNFLLTWLNFPCSSSVVNFIIEIVLFFATISSSNSLIRYFCVLFSCLTTSVFESYSAIYIFNALILFALLSRAAIAVFTSYCKSFFCYLSISFWFSDFFNFWLVSSNCSLSCSIVCLSDLISSDRFTDTSSVSSSLTSSERIRFFWSKISLSAYAASVNLFLRANSSSVWWNLTSIDWSIKFYYSCNCFSIYYTFV
jgi:hypothetical protein